MIITDNVITYINKKKELSALEQRWMRILSPSKIEFKCRVGKLNIVTETLSRCRSDQEWKGRITEDDIEIGLVWEISLFEEIDR